MVLSIAMHPMNTNMNIVSRLAEGLVTLRSFGSSPVVVKDNTGANRLSLKNSMPVSRTMTKSSSKKRKRGSNKLATVASVKRMIGGVLEKKQKQIVPGFSGLAQGIFYTFNVTAQITQATADGSRIGDVINLDKLVGNIRWYTNPKAAFYQLRILVLFSGEETNPDVTNFATGGLGATDIMVGATAVSTIGVINPKSCNVLYDNLVEINSAIDAFEDGVTTRLNIDLKGKKFPYQGPAGTMGKYKNLYVMVIGNWSRSATVLPTTVGVVESNMVLHYSDA